MRSITRSIGAAAMSSRVRAMLSAQSHATGDADGLTGDVGGLIGGQEQRRGGNLFGLAQPTQQSGVRHGVENSVAPVGYRLFEQRGADWSRRDHIRGNSIA